MIYVSKSSDTSSISEPSSDVLMTSGAVSPFRFGRVSLTLILIVAPVTYLMLLTVIAFPGPAVHVPLDEEERS